MCCAFALMVLLSPRVLCVLWWLFDTQRWSQAFSAAIWPILGFLFVPWTTLAFVLVSVPNGVQGLGWIWIGLGLLADFCSYGGGAFGNRDRVSSVYR